MLNKPVLCEPCAWWQSGLDPFCPDELKEGNTIVFVLQGPGETEVETGRPLTGKTGYMFDNTLLPKTGYHRGSPEVGIGNVYKCRWGDRNVVPRTTAAVEAAVHCMATHLRIPSTARVVVAMGEHASKYLAGVVGIKDEQGNWRDGICSAQGYRVLSTIHPADLYHDIRMKGPMFHFMRKARVMSEPGWEPPKEEFEYVLSKDFMDEAEEAEFLVCDTEYITARNPSQRILQILGLGLPSGRVASVRPAQLSPQARITIARWMVEKTWVFQEAPADVPVLDREFGLKPADYHDTALIHHTLWCELPHHLAFLQAMYTYRKAHKDLDKNDPYYNACDVVTTTEAYQGLASELGKDPACKAHYERRRGLLEVNINALCDGLSTEAEEVPEKRKELEAEMVHQRRKVQVLCGWPIDINSTKDLHWEAYTRRGYKVQKHGKTKRPSIDKDSRAKLLRDNPDAAWLRELHAYQTIKQDLTHFIRPIFDKQGRIFPIIYYDLNLHSQNTGRWSFTRPPVGTYPPRLRSMIRAFPGEKFIQWDETNIELHIMAVRAHDVPLLEGLDAGHDLHLIHTCQIFGLDMPPILDKRVHTDSSCQEWREYAQWEGSDDRRRNFSKRFVYRLLYGGDPATMDTMPEAMLLGLRGPELVQCATNWLNAHPAIKAEQLRIAAHVRDKRVMYTTSGRRWVLLQPIDKAIRQGLDFPMQATVCDIMEDDLLEISEQYPFVRLRILTHDGNLSAFPESMDVRDVYEKLAPIVYRKREVAPGKWLVPKATWSWGDNWGRLDKIPGL